MWSACIPLTTEGATSQNETQLAEMKLSGRIKITSSIF